MKLPKTIAEELERSGLPWRLERGGRHHKIFVADRLAGILPHSGAREADRRSELNTRAQVRRIIKEATR